MKRREFVALSAFALASPATVLAEAGGEVEYSPQAFDKILASGKPVLLDFYTTW